LIEADKKKDARKYV